MSTPVPISEPTIRYLRVGDLARVLGVDPRTVWRWESEGRIPRGTRIGKAVRWRQSDIDRLFDDPPVRAKGGVL